MVKRALIVPLLLAALVAQSAPAGASLSWVSNSQMSGARYLATLITLPDGRILASGGVDQHGSPLTTTEIYDPIANAWTKAAAMVLPRYRHTATLLKNGKVLVTGGFDGTQGMTECELYDPVANTWTPTGALASGRHRHTATLITSTGKVLAVGGFNDGIVGTWELYDPALGQWSQSGAVPTPRYDHSAVLLQDAATVLVAGGVVDIVYNPTNDAQRWNGGAWTAAAPMLAPHAGASGTLLPNGNVVIAGGTKDSAGTSSKDVESYNGTTWSQTNMLDPRSLHAASLAADGSLYLLGGYGVDFTEPVNAGLGTISKALADSFTVSDSCYQTCTGNHAGACAPCNPTQQICNGSCASPTVCVSTAPADPTVVCTAGQYVHNPTLSPSPQSGLNATLTFSLATMQDSITGDILSDSITLSGMNITATDGSVITVTGGAGFLPPKTLVTDGNMTPTVSFSNLKVTGFSASASFCSTSVASCPGSESLAGAFQLSGAATAHIEQIVYGDVTSWTGSGVWKMAGDAPYTAMGMNSILHPNGSLYVVGGLDDNDAVKGNNATLIPGIGNFSSAGSGGAPSARQYHTASLMPSGNLLVAGGDTGTSPPQNPTNTAQLYSSGPDAFAAANPMACARESHTATVLPDGRVLACGGYTNTNSGTCGATSSLRPTATCEVFDGTNWTTRAPMLKPRANHSATLLFTGQVLVTGGIDANGAPLATSELYDVFLDTWFYVTPMHLARQQHSATLMKDGSILVSGGRPFDPLGTSEIYNPGTLTWTLSNMSASRFQHATTFLRDGRVIATGGLDVFGTPLQTTEIYDPATNQWASAASMTSPRAGHTGVLLPNGAVLLSGGQYQYAIGSTNNTAEVYQNSQWTQAGGYMGSKRSHHTSTLLPKGYLLMVGGFNGSGVNATAEGIYFSAYLPSAFAPAPTSVSPSSGTAPSTLVTMTGTQLTGVTEAAGGMNYSNAAANYPHILLRPFDSGGSGGQAGSSFLIDASTTVFKYPWNDTALTFETPYTGCGYYMVADQSAGNTSTFTPMRIVPPPVGGAPTLGGSALSPTQLTLTFPSPNASNYYIYPASAPTTTLYWTSSPTVSIPSLSTNTPYGFVARAENCVSTSPLTQSVTVYTLAAKPQNVRFVSVSSFSATLMWDTLGNPGNTVYDVMYASAQYSNNAPGNVCLAGTKCTSTLANSITINGLVPSTTFNFSVSAFNGDGIPTLYTDFVTTLTVTDRPTNVIGFDAVGSVLFTWTGVPWATSYNVYAASTTPATLITNTTNTFFLQSPLAPNSPSAVKITAVQGTQEGPFSTTVTPYTLANAPMPRMVGVHSLDATLAWDTDGNPPTTPYEISYSTDNFALNIFSGLSFSDAFTGSSFTVHGLTANTTYQFRMRAQNFHGFASTFSVITATRTDLEVPLGISGVALGVSSITWTWSPVPFGTSYDVFFATRTTQLLGSVGTTSFIQIGMGINDPSQIVVRGRSNSITGPLSPASSVVHSMAAVPGVPAYVYATSNTITVAWSPNGNPAGTSYTLQAAKTPTYDSGFVQAITTATTLELGALDPVSTYYLRVNAINGDNRTSAVSASTVIYTTNGGIIRQNVNSSLMNIYSATLNSNRVATLQIFPETFTDKAQFIVQDSSRTPCGPIPAAVAITVAPAQQPQEPLTLTLSYFAGDIGVLDQSRLYFVRYDDATGACVPLKSSVNIASQTVTALIDHLSVYQIAVATPAATVNTASIWPNPLRPSQSGQSFMTIGPLPVGAEVQVFTIRGELVYKTVADGSGTAQWPAINRSGNKVASGVYLVLLKGGGTKILKAAIER